VATIGVKILFTNGGTTKSIAPVILLGFNHNNNWRITFISATISK